jgi:hypothetical protein
MALYPGLMIVTNIGATIFVLPVLAVAAVVAVVLHAEPVLTIAMIVIVGILPSPTSAGLQFVTHESAHLNPVLWRDQLDGIQRYGVSALRIWLLSIIVTTILVGNAAFYAQASFAPARILEILFILALMFWLAVHLYVYPLLMEQKVVKARLVYRNAVLMALARPLFTVLVTSVWWLILFCTTFTGLVGVIGLVIAALLQQNAAAVMLPTFRQSRQAAPLGDGNAP